MNASEEIETVEQNMKFVHEVPKKNLKKRNRIGKTPSEKINWTQEEVSTFQYISFVV